MDREGSAQIITIPDPKPHFIVEVDAFEVGVGAVLSLRAIRDK